MVDYGQVSELATAIGTLALAVTTAVSVRSANRSARVAERAMLAGIRPLLLPSRMTDEEQKVGFIDQHWVHLPGGYGTAEATDEVVYLTISLRNAGGGLGLLHGWAVIPDSHGGTPVTELAGFRRLTRDLYIAGGDIGFWQGAIRSVDDPLFQPLCERIRERQQFVVELLYGDQEGAQRTISRITLQPVGEAGAWLATISRHFYPDREDPR